MKEAQTESSKAPTKSLVFLAHLMILKMVVAWLQLGKQGKHVNRLQVGHERNTVKSKPPKIQEIDRTII